MDILKKQLGLLFQGSEEVRKLTLCFDVERANI